MKVIEGWEMEGKGREVSRGGRIRKGHEMKGKRRGRKKREGKVREIELQMTNIEKERERG